MKLFLDDVRQPENCVGYMYTRIGKLNPIYLEEWKIVRDFREFCQFIESYYDKITHVSFDHDLADEHYDPSMFADDDYRYEEISNSFKERTGYDCAKWMIEFFKEKNHPLPQFIFIHSMNPIGREKIKNLFK